MCTNNTSTGKDTVQMTFKEKVNMCLLQNMPRKYIANFEVSAERNLRDVEITKLLRIYVIMYRIKVVTISIFKFIYPLITLVILGVVVQAILRIVDISIQHIDTELTITGVTALVTSLTALLATLYGNLKHMWKYLYDKNDETHVAEIVKAVQANDLKNKQSEAEVQRFQDAGVQRTTYEQLKDTIQASVLPYNTDSLQRDINDTGNAQTNDDESKIAASIE